MAENTSTPVGTSDMPTPQTFTYEKSYTISELFKKDLLSVAKELPYADAKVFLDEINMYPQGMPASVLNDYVRALGRLPYKYIAPLMNSINNKDNFEKYFIEIKQQQK